LIFLHELNGWVVCWNMADFVTVNSPADVLWGPGHLIGVPVGAWLEIVCVIVGLKLVMAVSVDNVH